MINFGPTTTKEVSINTPITGIKGKVVQVPGPTKYMEKVVKKEVPGPKEEILVPVEDKMQISRMKHKILQLNLINKDLQYQLKKAKTEKSPSQEVVGIMLFLQIVILILLILGVIL